MADMRAKGTCCVLTLLVSVASGVETYGFVLTRCSPIRQKMECPAAYT